MIEIKELLPKEFVPGTCYSISRPMKKGICHGIFISAVPDAEHFILQFIEEEKLVSFKVKSAYPTRVIEHTRTYIKIGMEYFIGRFASDYLAKKYKKKYYSILRKFKSAGYNGSQIKICSERFVENNPLCSRSIVIGRDANLKHYL